MGWYVIGCSIPHIITVNTGTVLCWGSSFIALAAAHLAVNTNFPRDTVPDATVRVAVNIEDVIRSDRNTPILYSLISLAGGPGRGGGDVSALIVLCNSKSEKINQAPYFS